MTTATLDAETILKRAAPLTVDASRVIRGPAATLGAADLWRSAADGPPASVVTSTILSEGVHE